MTPGQRFRAAVTEEMPLQVVGVINAYAAILARHSGFQALYLSGAGVANASFGLPDLGMTTLHDVLEDARRILSAVDLPMLVDIDTGWGSVLNISRAVREMTAIGVAAVHIEDQIQSKRCGHRPGKTVVETTEMMDRIKAATDARTDSSFIIMARTDALAIEGIEKTQVRIQHYIEAGADMIFLEGARQLSDYQVITKHCTVPVLANITEFGMTPLFSKEELRDVGVKLVLYPLSAFRAMSAAALTVYESIRANGTQKFVIDQMQTREALYEMLQYHEYEKKINQSPLT